ncbi:MAG TPA: CBS domain-containing protein [Acidobacteria bacterium]|nr:CBS domain-containing protein [Acidobacteriota bacterium]
MLVREIMHPDPVVIGPEKTLDEAYAVMRAKGVRHLPVVEKDRLVGIVTDRDLRLATSCLSDRPFSPEARLREVMKFPVHTADPLDPVEVVARTMRELKIGCMPVVEDGHPVGIITGIDLLDAMLRLTGVHRPSGRLEVCLEDRPGQLARLTGLLSERKVNIHSILSYPDEDGQLRIVLRVGSLDTRPLAQALCRGGFQVVWPPHHSCR